MSSLMEMILVGIVVGVAGVWAVRAIWRAVRKGNICSDCSSSADCPMVNNPKMLQQLGDMGQCGLGTFECPSKPENSPKTGAKA